MIVVAEPARLADHVGAQIRPDTVAVTDAMIDAFLALFGDATPIHAPGARPRIVPGNLLIGLIPALLQAAFRIEGGTGAVTAGYERIRFANPLVAGGAVRPLLTVADVRVRADAVFVTTEVSLHDAEKGRPVLAARVIDRYFRARWR